MLIIHRIFILKNPQLFYQKFSLLQMYECIDKFNNMMKQMNKNKIKYKNKYY